MIYGGWVRCPMCHGTELAEIPDQMNVAQWALMLLAFVLFVPYVACVVVALILSAPFALWSYFTESKPATEQELRDNQW
jgi:hypothetical protein